MFVAAGQASLELKILAGRRIHQQRVRVLFGVYRFDVGQGGTLCILYVVQQTAGGLNGVGQLRAPESRQIPGIKLRTQCPGCGLDVEMPGWHRPCFSPVRQPWRRFECLLHEYLCRVQAFEFALQVLRVVKLRHPESSGA